MAGQFVDTFDHYSDTTTMWDSVHNTPVIGAFARFPAIGSYPNKGVSIASNVYMTKNMKSNQGTLITFMTYGCAALPGGSQSVILAFFDNGTLQCYLGVTPTGALQFYKNLGVPIGASSALGLIAPSAVPNHGIEVSVTFSASGGVVQCWLDGSQVINSSGLNTIASANSYANQVGIGSFNGLGYSGFSIGQYCDYIRVWDNTGSYQNAPVGFDCRKLTKLPTGAGALTGWTANGAGANWQCVNENPPDDDTTYVSSSGLNSDSYAMGTSGLSGVPSMVCVKSRVRKDDGATRTLQIGVRSGTNNGLGSAYTMGSTYVWVDGFISVDPATGSPPTAAAADAFQFLKTEAS